MKSAAVAPPISKKCGKKVQNRADTNIGISKSPPGIFFIKVYMLFPLSYKIGFIFIEISYFKEPPFIISHFA